MSFLNLELALFSVTSNATHGLLTFNDYFVHILLENFLADNVSALSGFSKSRCGSVISKFSIPNPYPGICLEQQVEFQRALLPGQPSTYDAFESHRGLRMFHASGLHVQESEWSLAFDQFWDNVAQTRSG